MLTMRDGASEAAKRGATARYSNPFQNEPMAISPLDRMTDEQFRSWLVKKFGAEYLEPVRYGWVDGVYRTIEE